MAASPVARKPKRVPSNPHQHTSPRRDGDTTEPKRPSVKHPKVRAFDFTQPLPVASLGVLSQSEAEKKYKPYEVFDKIDPVLTQSLHRSCSPGAARKHQLRAKKLETTTTRGMHREGKVELPPCKEISIDFSEAALTKKQQKLLKRTASQQARQESLITEAKSYLRPGAEEALGGGGTRRAYGVQRKNIFEDPSMRYEPDGDDMRWCMTYGVTLPNLIEIFTILEINYVQYIINAVRSVEQEETKKRSERIGNGDAFPLQKESSKKPRERCVICGEVAEENILRCRTCGQLCHAECCCVKDDNMSLRERKKWQCDVCALGSNPEDIRCKLCAKTGGFFIRVEKTTKQFAHLVCTLLLPEGKVDEDKREASFAPLDKKRDTLTCSICHVAGGACVKCAHPRCHHGLHPSCAASAGLVERRSETGGAVRAFCKEHYSDYSSLVIPNHLKALTCGADLGKDAEREALSISKAALKNDSDGLDVDFDEVAGLWKKKRQQARVENEHVVDGINEDGMALVTRILHPAVLRLGGTTDVVRCSRFLCLIPAFQHHLSAVLEGAVPQLEEHSAAPAKTTRSSGNNKQLLDKMAQLEDHIHNLTSMAHNVKRREQLKAEQVETDLQLLEHEFFSQVAVAGVDEDEVERLPSKRKRK